MTALGVQPQQQGLVNNDNGVLRKGARLPSSVAPKGPVIGDLWYNTAILALQVWNGSAWVGVASGGVGNVITPGFEIYHPASTPYIDFHRAANPAGDGNADFNVRFINDSNNVLRLSTLNPANNNGGGLFLIGNAYVGSHPVHGGGNWAAFGHNSLQGSADYAYMHNSSGDTLINGGGSAKVIRFFIDGATQVANFNTTRCFFPVKSTHGPNDFTDAEPITVTGGASGISYRDRSDNAARWVTYTTSGQFIFWDQQTDRVIFTRGDGRAVFGNGTNGRAEVGPWTGNNNYATFSHRRSTEQFVNWFTVLAGNPDIDRSSYFNCAPNGVVFISRDNNVQTLDLHFRSLPALGGGNTVNYQAGGSEQVGYIASTGRFKASVRSLKETSDLDSGTDSPIFKLRPVRHNWKQATKDKKRAWLDDGVVNGDEINERFPNGVVGLLAEEVAEICPDAVIWTGQHPSEPWDVSKHGLPPTPDTEIFPGWEDRPIGLDNDRLIAYLIDAVQHLKEELDELKGAKEKK